MTTNAPTTSVTNSSCNVNDTTCTTIAKINTTATTVAKMNITTIPTLQSTSSTPAVPSTAVPATISPNINLEIFKNFNPDMCTCDLQRQFCDINCCCDKDCSSENKLVFKACYQEMNLNRDTSFCQYMDYIYINNTPYAWEINQNGLFCIAKSNLPARYTLQKKEPITTLEDADLQKQNRYSWPKINQQLLQFKFNATESFAYGANTWIIRNNRLEQLQLPNSFVTQMCIIKQNMKFLQNYKTKCNQILSEDNPSIHAETYFKGIFVVRAPQFLNVTLFEGHFKDCPRNICLPIEVQACDDDYKNCLNFSTNDKRIRTSCHFSIATGENLCSHITQKVKFNFYHNGTQGFTKVDLFLILKNLSYSLHDKNFEFSQQFEVNYLWSNYSLNYSLLLSGNPGYLIGKPVVMANLVTYFNATNSTTSNITENISYVSLERNVFNIADNFLIFPDSKGGLCVLNNSTHVASEFGYNMIVKCKIKKLFDTKNINASDVCKVLQKEIFKYWPISNTNLTEINKLIGSFGNANETVFTYWIKILSNKTPGQILNITSGNYTYKNTSLLCYNLITTLKIDIFHSRVDFKELCNQEKIIGTTFHFGTPKAFEFNLNKNKQFIFETTIREELMFFDVTTEKIEKFVDPPSFKISLPYDFFYPFVKVGDTANALHVCPFVVTYCFIFNMLFHL